MDAPQEVKQHEMCLLAHDLLNKLAAIVGHCDILEAKDASPSEYHERLRCIRALATVMAQMLQQDRREADAVDPNLKSSATPMLRRQNVNGERLCSTPFRAKK